MFHPADPKHLARKFVQDRIGADKKAQVPRAKLRQMLVEHYSHSIFAQAGALHRQHTLHPERQMDTRDKHTALVYGLAQDFVHKTVKHLRLGFHEVLHLFESGKFEEFLSQQFGALSQQDAHTESPKHPGYWTDFHQEVLADAIDSADLSGVFDVDL